MSAQPNPPGAAPDLVNVEIDGKPMAVPKGSMIIQAADKVGIPIPRFCYHDRLPIAANCRMCLVDVEKAPKPMPACATPVMEGMKVYTRSKRALDSQRNVMEFLLINHPLDCPICDQGGECELQDLAMGYGRSVSRFVERKRVVPDEDLGPLVATEMTRCIQCTRCVRFTAEVAGTHELGGMFRGEHLEIGTYVGKALESELSGNIIDVCPVGALTNKVYRYRARPWELVAREAVGVHDALHSNLHLHARRGELLRAVPRTNDAINECWISDRDRYAHQGLYASDRARQPMVRNAAGELAPATWDEALAAAAEGLKRHGAELGALVSPLASCEEGALLARLVRGLGSDAIDHRLRTLDFADRAAGATFEMPLAEIEQADAILIVGSNPRLDAPLLGHRVRKAWKRGAQVHVVNPIDFAFHFEPRAKRVVTPGAMAGALAQLAAAVGPDTLPVALREGFDAAPDDASRAMAEGLKGASRGVVIFGDLAVQHPQASVLRAITRALAKALGFAYDEIAGAGNSVGLARVGVVPQRPGHDVRTMLAAPRPLLLHGAEAPEDFGDGPGALAALARSPWLLAFVPYVTEALRAHAHVVLPIGTPYEVDGSYVNVDGRVQVVPAAGKLPGEARAGWRVLRALGAALGLPGFEFVELAELRAQFDASRPAAAAAEAGIAAHRPQSGGLVRIASVAPYRSDAIVRRAQALQGTPIARPPMVVLHPGEALARGFGAGSRVVVGDGRHEVELEVQADPMVPHGAAWIESGHPQTSMLAPTGAELNLRRV